jgi:hypothetical protein
MRFGPKNLIISFSSKRLTHFGGVYLLYLFFKKIGLKSLLYNETRFIQRNNKYTVSEEILSIIYPAILGLGRIETSYLLKQNGIFQYLTGLPSYPNPTTLRRYLFRMATAALPKLRNLHDKMLMQFSCLPKQPTSIIFDLDSTVLTLYGKQELARIGYNPSKPGRVSYHPLLCFNGFTKDYWHGELRPGDTHTSTGAIEILEASFAKIPASVKTAHIRADRGFFNHNIIETIEFYQAKFIIVAKATRPIKQKLSSLRYRKHTSGTESAHFYYQPHGWQKKYRFIVIRRPLPEEQTNQLSLFTKGRYSYQVFVTNMTQTALYCWKFYNKRASVELIIKELKQDYPLAKIPTKHFHANEAYFHILLFSYNLLNWFKRLCLPKEFQTMTLNTLRYRLLLIPGEIVRSGNKPVLKLPVNFQYKSAFQYAVKIIEKLKF